MGVGVGVGVCVCVCVCEAISLRGKSKEDGGVTYTLAYASIAPACPRTKVPIPTAEELRAEDGGGTYTLA